MYTTRCVSAVLKPLKQRKEGAEELIPPFDGKQIQFFLKRPAYSPPRRVQEKKKEKRELIQQRLKGHKQLSVRAGQYVFIVFKTET